MILKQAIYLLKLRFRTAVRIIRDLGWLRAFLLGVFVIVFAGQLAIIPGSRAGWIIGSLGFITVSVIHQQRGDLHFLQAVSLDYKVGIAVEYLAIILPFLIILLYRGLISAALVMVIATGIIPFIPQGGKQISGDKYYKLSPFCSLQSYEWIAGFRRFKIFFMTLIVLGLVSSVINYIGTFVILYLMTGLISSFYAECEPRRLLLLSAEEPSLVLQKKVGKGVGLYALSTLPVWISLFIIYPNNALYTAFFLLMNMLLLSSIILAKYMLYEGQRNLDFPLITLFLVFSIFSFIPYLQTVLVLILAFLWIKAENHLRKRVYA